MARGFLRERPAANCQYFGIAHADAEFMSD